jgi:hypothetical protein
LSKKISGAKDIPEQYAPIKTVITNLECNHAFPVNVYYRGWPRRLRKGMANTGIKK